MRRFLVPAALLLAASPAVASELVVVATGNVPHAFCSLGTDVAFAADLATGRGYERFGPRAFQPLPACAAFHHAAFLGTEGDRCFADGDVVRCIEDTPDRFLEVELASDGAYSVHALNHASGIEWTFRARLDRVDVGA